MATVELEWPALKLVTLRLDSDGEGRKGGANPNREGGRDGD